MRVCAGCANRNEATANVDPENEKELMEAIAELTHDKTVIMIAHRLKTVRHADQIFVVDHGEIVQQGTHGELVAVDGLYHRFVAERQQAAGWKGRFHFAYYSTKPVPVKLIRALLCSAFIRPLTLITQRLQGAEKHLAASLLPHFLAYFWGFSSSSSRSVIFLRLMPRVDPLCSSAEVVGGRIPATPSAIRVRLKPTMKR